MPSFSSFGPSDFSREMQKVAETLQKIAFSQKSTRSKSGEATTMLFSFFTQSVAKNIQLRHEQSLDEKERAVRELLPIWLSKQAERHHLRNIQDRKGILKVTPSIP